MIFNPVILCSLLFSLNYVSCIVAYLAMREINDNWTITFFITSVKTGNNFAETSENKPDTNEKSLRFNTHDSAL